MTTATLNSPVACAEHGRIPMRRLVEIELRKMVDTRAGLWLVIGAVALIVVVLGILLATNDQASSQSFVELLRISQIPMLALMPVIGVLAATSEWNQRTTLTTFALVPARSRLLVAKVIGTLLLSTAATLIVLALTAIAALLAPLFGSADANWGLGLSDFGELLVNQMLSGLFGLALGAALLNSALAIVLFFVLPTVWAGLTIAFGWENLQLWLDPGTSWDQLTATAPMTAELWAKVGATTLVWVVLPLSIGITRILRRDVD